MSEKIVSYQRLDFVDSLRGLAATCVVMYHLALMPNPALTVPLWAKKFVLNGGTGVTLFFVASAFTLCLTMDGKLDKYNATLTFYVRRIFRIAPLFYSLLLVSLFRDWYFYDTVHSLQEFLLSCFFGFNLVPGFSSGIVWASWTIGIEMIFYLFFPLICRFVDSLESSLVFLFISMLLIYPFGYLIDLFDVDTASQAKYIKFSVIRHLPNFAIGMVAYFIYKKRINFFNSRKAGIALVCASLYFYVSLLNGIKPTVIAPMYWQGVIFAILLIGLSCHQPAVMVNRVTRFLGKISFSMYLIHPVLVILLLPAFLNIYNTETILTIKYFGSFSLLFAVLCCTSLMTYVLIEKPGIRLGYKLTALLSRKTSTLSIDKSS